MPDQTAAESLGSLHPGLRQKLQREPLRLLTCGSVDDGKSTLIGRLLLETGQVFDDQLAELERDSQRYGGTGELDPSLLLDGLDAERQQGITIDVAYRYFSTARRAFIVADTPGHEQYTRNMVTAASNSDLAVLLADAQKGMLTQTRRHALLCSLLGIRQVVLAVNKCDLIGYDEHRFRSIRESFENMARDLKFETIAAIPVSARVGDNVVGPRGNTPWYDGPSLLEYLETADVEGQARDRPFRLCVQYIIRSQGGFRGVCGTISAGSIREGDPIVVLPSRVTSVVGKILRSGEPVASATAGEAVCLVLSSDVDIARGDMLAKPGEEPSSANHFAAHLVCFSPQGVFPGRSYLMRTGNKFVPASITSIKHRIDANTGQKLAAHRLELNEIAVGNISSAITVPHDAYGENKDTGSFILVDRFTNETVAAGMIDFDLYRATSVQPQRPTVDRETRAKLKHQQPVVIWFTGLPGSGKSTLANLLESRLHARGYHTYLLDGDNLRQGLNRDLGFTEADRVENIRRAGTVAQLFFDAGLIVLCSFVSPFRAERQMVRDLFAPGEFLEVFVDTSVEECIQRDPKGLYARALRKEIKNFTGIDAPYQPPETPELRLRTETASAEQLVEEILRTLKSRKIID